MIVSHAHKFIFIKTGKTAGTSVEIALSRFLGPDDIATPIKPDDERLRAPDAARHYLRQCGPWHWKRLLGRLPGPIGRFARGPRRAVDFYNHIGAARIRDYLGAAVFDGYFKFAFERNPWDRQVSYYYWSTRDERPRPDFRRFTLDEGRRTRAWPLYTIDGTVAVDFVGRYETLEADLAKAFDRIGLPGPVDLPHAKGGIRPEGDYRRHYDAETRALIERVSAKEIALMGYTF